MLAGTDPAVSWLAQASGDSVGDIIAMLHLSRALAESLAHYSSCMYIVHLSFVDLYIIHPNVGNVEWQNLELPT